MMGSIPRDDRVFAWLTRRFPARRKARYLMGCSDVLRTVTIQQRHCLGKLVLVAVSLTYHV